VPVLARYAVALYYQSLWDKAQAAHDKAMRDPKATRETFKHLEALGIAVPRDFGNPGEAPGRQS